MHLGRPARSELSTKAAGVFLAIQIVNRLAYRVPDFSRGILHVADDSIRRTFIGHLIVSGKIAYTLLDRACYGSHLALGPSLGAPVESLAGCAFHSVVARRIVRF